MAEIGFDEWGIAHTLKERHVAVPVNQRPYAWEHGQVERFLLDLIEAFDNDQVYFLGTIVFTKGKRKEHVLADGQQRSATTAIIISAIRDYLLELGDVEGARTIEADHLIKYVPKTGNYEPKIRLNAEDHDFFLTTILAPPDKRQPYGGRSFLSHSRLKTAAELAQSHIANITVNLPKSDKPGRLYDFLEFLDEKAKVFVIDIPDDIGNAFTMFETLNGRGLEASQIDVLKNFLFEKGQARQADIHARWTSMLSVIESQGDDDLLLTFIRHYWISENGPTLQKQLGEQIRASIKSERQAIDFVGALDANATDYVALLMPREHPRWSEYSRDTRDYIHTMMRQLGTEQIRPLMLAVARKFSIKETEKAFRLFLSWTVRFLIVGGGGGGQLDRLYGDKAKDVSKGKITTAKELATAMGSSIPTDEQFKTEFATANVRRASLARYYLRALELYEKGEAKPQFLPSEDVAAVNLEHVLPINPGAKWDVTPDVAEAYYKRLGNMVLLLAKENTKIGNDSFDDKRSAFKQSPFVLTNDVGKSRKWGPDQIAKRQAELAELAPKVWPS
jgi:hypothetical protein